MCVRQLLYELQYVYTWSEEGVRLEGFNEVLKLYGIKPISEEEIRA